MVRCTMEQKGDKSEKRSSPRSSLKENGHQDITDRILNSATGLLRDSFSPASSQSVNTLANVLASEGKAGSSTASTIAGPATSSDSHGIFKASQGIDSLPNGKNAFRELPSGASEFAQGPSLDQFMERAQDQCQMPVWQDSPTAKGKQRASDPNGYRAEPPASDVGLSATWDAIAHNKRSQAISVNTHGAGHGTNGINAAAHINGKDGADVLKLLQDPKASFWVDMPKQEEEDILYTISEEDMRIADEIVCLLGNILASKPGSECAISAAVRGEPFPRFSSFFDEIENYHDEVWGYLRPVVEEAKREVMAPGAWGGEGGPATRRLRMILAHVDISR